METMIAQPKPQKVTQDETRLDFVRQMACLIWTADEADTLEALDHIAERCDLTMRRTEAHHVRKGTHAGTGRKPPASRTVPLCPFAHAEYHQIGHDSFCAKYGLDLEAHIQRINREFKAAHPEPKRERKPRRRRPKIVQPCENCNRTHDLPLSATDGEVVHWMCRMKRMEYRAR